MNFNEKKYKNCINHLIDIKTFIIISYVIIFTCIGIGIGLPLMQKFGNKWYIISLSTGISFIFGLLLGLSSVWRVEMKIQEAYWKIDVMNELKKQSDLYNKKSPIAKTVVAIENTQTPSSYTQKLD